MYMVNRHATTRRKVKTMSTKLKTRKTQDAQGQEIQHSLYDTGTSFELHRWEEATGKNTMVDEIEYHGYQDKLAARSMALGALSSLHHQAMREVKGDTFTDKNGVTWYWADGMGRYITIPED